MSVPRAYAQRPRVNVSVASDTAGGVQKRIEAGEKFDLVIGTTAVLERLTRQSKVSAYHAHPAQLERGMSAKRGTAKPALADSGQVKAVLLAARNIAYVDPASG